jgi:16S rRNA G966 N2-methylase RsmD
MSKFKIEWHEQVLALVKNQSKNGKFKVLLIDPPYEDTGCKLTYNKMKD